MDALKSMKAKVWRWFQSSANLSLAKIPVNREKYRENASGLTRHGTHRFRFPWPFFAFLLN
jgi:hypothetical protein